MCDILDKSFISKFKTELRKIYYFLKYYVNKQKKLKAMFAVSFYVIKNSCFLKNKR